ncbi:uncharacterized protein LOC112270113 [Brachypodium distachyon]|uniref:uncharacterized protein LOC112270113 n=1 Tax=Brachypodium distachyon TaxID=15368 RepID=UPI000D0DEF62|nr:uncharacterized protein LOC112270113 [Brachypodium distachyon]|eukprot:XP_024313591.1 uncharacterized protein LOC112270113 [Brachypodium distachyon]
MLPKASQIKSLVLSKEYLDEFGDAPFCKFTSPIGESSIVDGKFMYRLFGHCKMLEANTIDLIISYWKGSPYMKHLFDSGDHVLLGPFAITYMLDVSSFPPVDSKGNKIERSPFDVKEAAKMFSYYVRECENLLMANVS